MNITFIRDKIRHDGGGASRSIHLLAESLTKRGHDVEVVTVHFTGEPNRVEEEYSYTISEKPIRNYTQVDGAARTYRVLNEIDDPDVLHCFQPQLHPIVGAWKRNNPGTVTVGRLNTYENFCTNHALIENNCYENCSVYNKWEHHPSPSVGSLPKMAFDTRIQPRLLNQFDALFALSPAVKKIFDGYGVDRTRLRVVPNFYEEEFGFSGNETITTETTARGSEYRILFVGRLVSKKGVHLLLDAVAEMDLEPAVDIVGDGAAFQQLGNHTLPNVTFHGWVDHQDLSQYYQRADVFVHPGLWPEPFGRTVLEAMQHDCVPVVSDVGGPPWIVGGAGVTFPKGKTGQLASVLESLSSDTERQTYREQIPEELARFSPERVIETIESAYRELTE